MIALVKDPADHLTRRQRRSLSRPRPPRFKQGSIIDHSLHKSYPRRLRAANEFKHRSQAPSTEAQVIHNLVRDSLDPRSVAYHRRRWRKVDRPSSSRSSGPYCDPFPRPSPTQPPRRRGRSPRRRVRKNQLVSDWTCTLPKNQRWKARPTAGKARHHPTPSAPPPSDPLDRPSGGRGAVGFFNATCREEAERGRNRQLIARSDGCTVR